jgi:tetratricopeptide (TPR) repeat protein
MPDADPALVCDLRTACGEALYRSTSPRYRRVLDLAADDARKLRDAGRLARVVLAGHPSGMSSAIGERNEEILGLLREALDALDASEHGLRARLLAVLGCELQYTNDTSKDDLLREAIAMARSADDRATLAAVLSSACYSMADPHAWDERLAAARDLLTVSTELGDPESTFWGHLHCYDTLVEGADLDEARLHLGQAARLADDLHQALHRWRVATRRAGELAVAGRLEEAQEGVLTARADAAALHRSLVGVSTVQAYAIQRDQGRLTELAPDLEERLHAQPDQYLWYPILANVQLDGGRASEARATFERGMTLFSRALRSGRPWLICLCILGDLAVKLDERDAAGVLYDDLLAVPGRIAGVFASAPFTFTDHVLAVLAGGLGRFDDAERHFAAAAELARRAGAPIWLARTEAEWARMLTNRRRPGDAERARELLDDALATARQLGAGGVERLAVGVGEASG